MLFDAHDLLWFAACGSLLTVATWSDITTMRIPNWSVLAGASSGLIIATLPGGLGFQNALIGGAVGLALLLPLYAFRVMGAGDVKLMAALGCFSGYPGIFGLILATLLAGGIFSLLWAARHEQIMSVLNNVRLGLLNGLTDVTAGKLPNAQNFPVSSARVPYACAIALGMVSFMLLNDRF